MKELEYPFDSEFILKKKRSLRRELLKDTETARIKKKVAVLCGSTVNDICDVMRLFLLNTGIEPEFYISEYNKYWEDVMFDNPELEAFAPDIIYIHTSTRNIHEFPNVKMKEDEIDTLLDDTYAPFEQMWEKIAEKYQCPVIQNNFEQPFYRLLGNKDVSDVHGRLNFVCRLNDRFYEYARTHDNFYINDINYMASTYGIKKWADPFYWYMYKYALALPAIPEFAYNICNIIKSIYGKNKKALVLDLDNTLWGGIIGDDGAENIQIGQETPTAEIYSEFQEYLKAHKDLGILLNIDSKNDEDKALSGFERPDSVLKKDDFLVIKANWEPKDLNLVAIADEINIGTDSLVFVDDNPAERMIVKEQVPEVAVPDITKPEHYIEVLDQAGYFEVTNFSDDDLKRNSMYKANVQRKRQKAAFTDYTDYLRSLEMVAEIEPFNDTYMSRIAQLTNKTNQFNLTTRRCSMAEIEQISDDSQYITLYGKLTDKFGDNGVVAILFGHLDGSDFHIDLWLMSCRVLKRDLEFAMMDELVKKCREHGVATMYGYYYPTAKNGMVKDFYEVQQFEKISEDEEGNAVWKYEVPQDYEDRNKVIKLKGEE